MGKNSIRRILVCVALVLLTAGGASAQSMTDDQIIRYVLQEKERGTDRETIVRHLTQRGVSIDQLQRIYRKVEAEQRRMGAVDLTQGTQPQGSNRLRTRQQVADDERQQRQNHMVRSQREEQEWRYMTREQRQQAIDGEVDFFDIDSLAYYASQVPREQQVFGRNIFSQENLSFEPNSNMATPANYRLGAGDVVIIDIWGAAQESIEATVSPDGAVVIEGVGPVSLAGLSVAEATRRLKTRLSAYYSDCNVSLSLGQTRSIQVQVAGEVVMPGTYTISSLATAFNALYAAGGISDVGTLRDIKVYRSGRVIATIDVYDYLLNGNAKGDIRLQDNDIVLVGPYDCLVEVRGKVRRPMFYEMRPSESVRQVIDMAGGFTGDAFTRNVRLVRKSGAEYSIHTVDEFAMGAFMLTDGDSIFVDSVMPRFSNMVEVQGAVMHPGQFQMDGSVHSVRDLIKVAEGLREDAFTQRAVMHRQKADLTLEMISIDLQGIINGTAPDIPLQKNDYLFVPSAIDMTGEQTLRINGEVNFPGTYMYADGTTVQDLIILAGGLTRAASTAKIDVFRRSYKPGAKASDLTLSEVFSFDLDHGFMPQDTAFVLLPFDEVQVRKSPVYNEQQNVVVSGCINFEGEYAMTNREFRLSDLVRMAGGLSQLAYAKGARLVRQMTQEELDQREASLRQSQIALYEQALQANKEYDRQLADTLLDMKMNLGNTYNVAIDLEAALAAPGGTDDIVLRANDQLYIPQFSNTVKISGEVMYPISINYKKGASLSYYIKRAGGYSARAHKSKTYTIYMNGSVDKLGRRARGSHLAPGCEIVVPTKPKREGMSTAEIMVIGTSTVSLSSMIISLINLLK